MTVVNWDFVDKIEIYEFLSRVGDASLWVAE